MFVLGCVCVCWSNILLDIFHGGDQKQPEPRIIAHLVPALFPLANHKRSCKHAIYWAREEDIARDLCVHQVSASRIGGDLLRSLVVILERLVPFLWVTSCIRRDQNTRTSWDAVLFLDL